MDISPRILKEAQRQAIAIANRMHLAYQQRRLKSWQDVEKTFGIQIPTIFTAQPFTYGTFSTFKESWKNSTQARLVASTLITPADEKAKILIDKNVSKFGNITLYPEQEGCFKAIREAMFGAGAYTDAALQDGTMGSGKTYVAGALMAWLIKENKILNQGMNAFRLHPFMVFTPKGVVEHWKRVLYEMGLAEYVDTRKIYVFSNGEFLTDIGDEFCDLVEDPLSGERTLTWKRGLSPILAVLDECHNFIRPTSRRTQKIHAMFESPLPVKTLMMSATPMEKVNDALTLVLGVKKFMFNGTRIKKDNFSYFAHVIDSNPQKPNREGVKRLRKALSPYIFSLPYIKPKYKAINLIWLVDFENDRHRAIYTTAHERYIKVCEKSGKNTAWGQFERFIALNNYRKTVEPLRAGHLAARAADNFRRGDLSTAIGCAFKETVAEVVFQLTDKYSIPRSSISLIWGGKRSYSTEMLMTQAELDTVLHSPLESLMNDLKTLKRVKLTLRYLQDQHEHDENPEEQSYRHAKLKELKLLGKQSDGARQDEIDRFQDGTTKICIFTLASGGVGLSLDRDKQILLPREGLFTPVYNGKEFQQVLGRLVRRASMSDARQYITMMRGTVEQSHVAPILDTKLKCIAEITNRNFDVIDLLSHSPEENEIQLPASFRDINQATLDADKDDTIVTDFHKPTEEEDEDDEEVPEDGNIIKLI